MLETLLRACAILVATAVSAAALDLTPPQTEGPYYPRARPAETDADLTTLKGRPPAKGTRLALRTRVVDPDGKPIAGARVEIWQTDAQGIYMHPDDPGHKRRDPNFQSYGEARTGTDGTADFVTIRPAAYEARPSHIHVKVTPPGGATLTTQLYFADDPGLARDGIARRLGKALDQVTLRPRAGAQGQEAEITLVVRRGRS